MKLLFNYTVLALASLISSVCEYGNDNYWKLFEFNSALKTLIRFPQKY